MTKTIGRLLRRSVLVLTALSLVLGAATALAPAASAGEMNPNYSYQNGKCQRSPLDIDCYHDDVRLPRHKDCLTRLGKIIGVDASTNFGKEVINLGYWYCQPQRPSGEYLLQIYHPTCPKVGWSSAQCRAYAKR